VFVKAFEKVGKYQERRLPFSAWLYRIARNHLIDHVRTLQKRPPGGPDGIEEAAGAADPRAEDAFTRMLDREMLDVALAVLGEDQRRAVQLGFLEGLSVAETALVMRRSEDAIKKLQARGLANLRRVLDPAASGRPDVTCTPALVAAA